MPILGIIASSISASKAVTSSYESIATQTVGAGGAASVTFSSIPSTFKHLQIRGIFQMDSAARMRINGATTGYSTHILYGDGASVGAAGGGSDTKVALGDAPSATAFGAVVVDILDYQNTNKYKTVRSLEGYDLNGSGQIYFNSASYQYTTAITSLSIYSNSGSVKQYSSFALYGVKG